MIAYVPTGFDPRRPPGDVWPAESVRADLAALRPAFDGLVLYDYRPEITPTVLEQAAALGYRAVLLGIWDPRSDAEIAGTAELVRRWGNRLALAVVIGNEGINDNRYDISDVASARDRLRALAGPEAPALPVSTSEPAGDYGWPPLLAFGDFLAPNIHPAIDQASLAPTAAVAWVHRRAEAIARAAGRPVLVKETRIAQRRRRRLFTGTSGRLLGRMAGGGPAEGNRSATNLRELCGSVRGLRRAVEGGSAARSDGGPLGPDERRPPPLSGVRRLGSGVAAPVA